MTKFSAIFFPFALAGMILSGPTRADLQKFHFLDIIPEPQQSASLGEPVRAGKVVVKTDLASLDPRIVRSLDRDFGSGAQPGGASPAERAIGLTFRPIEEVPADLCDATLCEREILRTNDEAYFLTVRDEGDRGIEAIVYAHADAGRFYGTKTLKKMLMKYDRRRIDQAAAFDYPRIGIRGVLEGYYGRAWAADATLKTIDWMADNKFNMFVYAPKDDAKNRSNWRAPYNDAELKRFKAYDGLCEKNFARFCWEISPGLTIGYSSNADYEALISKFDAVIEAGVDCFVLAFDDISHYFQEGDAKRFDSLAEAQASLINRTYEHVRNKAPNAAFHVVPTEYWNESLTPEYSGVLGRLVHPDIGVGWTGNEISSYSIPERDADLFASYWNRKPLLGDNLPVADTASLEKGPIHIAPIVRRPEALIEAIGGFAVNAMPWPYASRFGMATGADYAWNPKAYDAQTSLKKAIVETVGADAYGAFKPFADLNQGSLINHHDNQDLSVLLRKFQSGAEEGSLTGVKEEFLDYFTEMTKIEAEIRSKVKDDDLIAELSSWLKKTTAYGELGILAVDLMEKKTTGRLKAEEAKAFNEQFRRTVLMPGEITRTTLKPFFSRINDRLSEAFP